MEWEQITKFKKRTAIVATFLFVAFCAYGIVHHVQQEPTPIKELQTVALESPPVYPADTSLPALVPIQEEASSSTEKLVQLRETASAPNLKKSPTRQHKVEEKPTITEPDAVASPTPVAETNFVTEPAPIGPKVETPSEQEAEPASVSSTSPQDSGLVPGLWVWAGLGVNFTSYSQSVSGFSDVNFGRIKSPSQFFHGGFFLDDQFGMDFSYKTTPGHAEASATTTVENGSYEWKTLSGELLIRSEPTNATPSEWIWKVGAQQHEMPFIVPLTANSVSIQSNTLTALSAGVEYRKLTPKNVRIESFLRYQYPLSSHSNVGTDFKLQPRLTVDGSLGASYQFKPNFYIGVFWYGQYHSYVFDYVNNGSSYSGTQKLFFTNFDLRLGVEF